MAKCQNAGCVAHGQWVTCNLGMTTLNVGMDFEDEVKCPMCRQTPSDVHDKDNMVVFSNCIWSFEGRRADKTKMRQQYVDTGPDGYVKMPEGQAQWRALEIKTMPRPG